MPDITQSASTSVTVLSTGHVQIQSILPTGYAWSSAAQVDPTKVPCLLVDSGGDFERTLDALVLHPVSGPVVTTGATTDNTVTFVFETTGTRFGKPWQSGIHDGEDVEFAETLPAGVIYEVDGGDVMGSESIAASSSVTNNSAVANPTPTLMFAMAPKQRYTGDVEVLFEGYSRYGHRQTTVKITDSDTPGNEIEKIVTSRSVVDIGSDNHPTTKADLFRVVFTAAEIASAGLIDGPAEIELTFEALDGSEQVTDATGSNITAPRPWPIYLDQAGAVEDDIQVAYIHAEENVTTGALSGGVQFTKGNRIEASATGTGTVIGIVAEDYAGSGTLRFWRCNPHNSVGYIDNTATITEYAAGTNTATGVTATATADSEYTIPHGTTPASGILNEPGTPFPSLTHAVRAVSLANEANGHGKQGHGRYIFTSPVVFGGNHDFMSESNVESLLAWMELEVADGYSDEDVFIIGDGGQGSHWFPTSYYHFMGDWSYRAIKYENSGDWSNITGAGSGSDAHLWFDNLTTYAPGRTKFQCRWTNYKTLVLYGLQPGDLSDDACQISYIFYRTHDNNYSYGTILRNVLIDTPANFSGTHADANQFNNAANMLMLNSTIRNPRGSSSEHYDDIQSAGNASYNIIFKNLICVGSNYQHLILSIGGYNLAFVNIINYIIDDGDLGSANVYLDNSAELDHAIFLNGTYLNEGRTDTVGGPPRTGQVGTNVVFQSCIFGGVQNALLETDTRMCPHPHAGLQGVAVIATTTTNGNAGDAGVVSFSADDAALTDLFEDPANLNFAPKPSSVLVRKLSDDLDIHGSLLDAMGNRIQYGGVGSIGAIQTAAIEKGRVTALDRRTLRTVRV